MFRKFFYHWEAVFESITREKVEKQWNSRPAFFHMEIRLTRAPTRQLTPDPPSLRMQHSDFFLPTALRLVSVLASDVMFPSKWSFRLVYPRSRH